MAAFCRSSSLCLSFLLLLMNAIGCCAVKLGIRMCEEKCFRLKDCIGFHFIAVHLKCRILAHDPRRTVHGTVIDISQRKDIKGRICTPAHCSAGGRCLRNKAGHDVCVWTSGKSEGFTNKAEQLYREGARLLIIPGGTHGEIWQEMNLKTGEIMAYKYLKLNDVVSACYKPKSRKVLISTTFPQKMLHSHQIGTYITNLLAKNVIYYNMAVDEGRQLLFALKRSSSITFQKRQIESGHVNSYPMTGTGHLPHDIALDIRNKRVFVPFGHSLKIFGYDGSSRKGLDTRSGLEFNAVVFDINKYMLYYSYGKYLFQRNDTMTVTQVSKVVDELPLQPTQLQYYEGIFYASFHSSTLHITDVSNKEKEIRQKSLPFKHPIICLIV